MPQNASLPSIPVSIELLANNALHRSDSIAWIDRSESQVSRRTWQEIFDLSGHYRSFLQACGIAPGDRVAWQATNSLEWVLLELACNWIGAISCPIDIRMDSPSVEQLLRLVEPKLFLTDTVQVASICPTESFSSYLPNIAHLPTQQSPANPYGASGELWDATVRRPSPQSTATILFTSGTTGNVPKGVMLSHANLVLNAKAKLKCMPQYPSDHRINILPFAHAYARTCELTTWLLSASSMECCHGIHDLLRKLPSSQATLLNAVPLVFQKLLEHWQTLGTDPGSLQATLGPSMRQLASGGAPISGPLRTAFAEAGYPIFQGYGLTETGPVVCSNINSDLPRGINLSGVGPPVEGMQIRIDDRANLYVRGTGVMLGYWNDPAATNQQFHDLDGTGEREWFSTGDLAALSPDGALQILGRSDDTIVLANGYKLHPLSIETTLKQLRGVVDCIALPHPHGRWQVLLQIDSNATPPGGDGQRDGALSEDDWRNKEWFERVRAHCSDEIRQGLARVEIHSFPWTAEEGLLNFKGGKKRSEFLQRFASK